MLQTQTKGDKSEHHINSVSIKTCHSLEQVGEPFTPQNVAALRFAGNPDAPRRDKHTPKCHLRVNIVLVFIFSPQKSLHLCKILIPFATILILSLWKRKYYDTDKHNRGFVCEQ